jgi:LmbE family N-acetylglucosaminyl deacetylase
MPIFVKGGKNMTILVVVAHPDDEVLGCGASISKWSKSGESVHILIMSDGESSRNKEVGNKGNYEMILLREEMAKRSGECLGVESIKFLKFPDNRMDSLDRLDVIQAIEHEVERLKPSIVVTHHYGDVNIDHRVVHESVITACRPQPNCSVKQILSFEICSSTEWQASGINNSFQPNWYVDVDKTFESKINALNIYKSEMREWPHARSIENIQYLARWRGASVGCNYAEAFVLLRNIT